MKNVTFRDAPGAIAKGQKIIVECETHHMAYNDAKQIMKWADDATSFTLKGPPPYRITHISGGFIDFVCAPHHVRSDVYDGYSGQLRGIVNHLIEKEGD